MRRQESPWQAFYRPQISAKDRPCPLSGLETLAGRTIAKAPELQQSILPADRIESLLARIGTGLTTPGCHQADGRESQTAQQAVGQVSILLLRRFLPTGLVLIWY